MNSGIRRHSILLRMLIILALAMFSKLSSACESCLLAFKESDKIEKAIRRLGTILIANEEFLAGLDPNDNSERMKAQSNINIAKKRGAILDSELKSKHSTLGTQECKQCLASGKKEP